MVVKRFLIVGAAATVAFATVAGCDSSSKPAASSSSGSSSSGSSQSSGGSDEQQIRDVLKQEEAAAASLDTDKLIALTCSKYRDEQKKQVDQLIPPLSNYGTADELAGKSSELATEFKKQFPSSSDATIQALADALANYDQAAYEKAFKAVFRENFKLTLDKVENIKITGDTATADVTSTRTTGDQPPETKTETTPFVKESGKWLDCQPQS
ncbi:MAG: hypothetical protein QOH60_41 [Mycobacterium sp.]|nr:hypothetical protein [Mycobacterium sp.]